MSVDSFENKGRAIAMAVAATTCIIRFVFYIVMIL